MSLLNKQLLSLSASAGSGKTYSLAVRFVGLLLLGAKANEILTLTFTNKAANEMKDRIEKFLFLLKEYTQDKSHSSEVESLIANLEEFGITKDKIKQNIHKVYNNFLFTSTQITTFDAFFYKILRKFCWYVGVSINTEIRSRSSVELENDFLDSLNDRDITFLARYLNSDKQKFSHYLSLMDQINSRINIVEKKLQQSNIKHTSAKIEENLSKSLQNVFEEIEQKAEEINRNNKKGSQEVKLGNIRKLFIGNKKSYETLSELTITEKSNHSYFKNLAKQTDCSFIDSHIDDLTRQTRDYYNAKEYETFRYLAQFSNKYKNARDKYIIQTSSLTFDDITHKVHYLLNQNYEREFFYFRLDDRWTHILLDEFQDTNLNQYEILRPMIDEILSGIGQKINDRSFFVVGDTKQAIYAFRDGDERIFDVLSNHKYIDKGSLLHNYRSERRIIDFVNVNFKDLFTNYEVQYLPEKSNKTAGYVKVQNILYDKDSSLTEENMLNAVYENIKMLLENGVKYSDIGIIGYKNDMIRKVVEFCQEQDKNLSFSTEKKLKLSNQKESKIIMHLIDYMMIRDDSVKKLISLKIKKLLGRRENDDLDLEFCNARYKNTCEFVKRVVDEFDMANETIIKILELSVDYDDLAVFKDQLEASQDEITSYNNNSIQAMTIHKSKGLEFEHLIVLDNIGKMNNTDKIIYVQKDLKIVDVFYKYADRERCDMEYKNAIEEANKIKDKTDLNVVYVAFTRAKKSLIILQLGDENKKVSDRSRFAIFNLQEQVQGEIIPSESKQLAKNDIDIVRLAGVKREAQSFTQKDDKKQSAYNIKYTKFGEAFHYLLQVRHMYKDLDLEQCVDMCRNKFGYYLDEGNTSIDEVKRRYCILQNDEEYLKLLQGKNLLVEKNYISKNIDTRIGRFDAILEDEKQIIVIDYKTSDNFHDKYVEQVKGYMEFLQDIYTNKVVLGYIVYCQNKVRLHQI